MATYTFEMDDDEWYAWANSVPRNENLDERLRELIREDTDD